LSAKQGSSAAAERLVVDSFSIERSAVSRKNNFRFLSRA